MSITILDVPAAVRFRTHSWRQIGGKIYQRSEFTGRTKVIRIGPAPRWTCELEIVPSSDPAYIQQVRSFLAIASRFDYAVRIFMNDVAQSAVPTCLVDGANQLGTSLNVDALPASQTILQPGDLMTVQLGSQDEQTVVLLTPLVSDSSGRATATFNEPLRQAPGDNAIVRISGAVAIMRIEDAVSFNINPGQVFDWPRLTAVEAF